MQRFSYTLTMALLLAASGWFTTTAHGQESAPRTTAVAESGSQESERREILESDRWRQRHRKFDDWLAVQRTYGPEEVATIKQEMRERIARMTPSELQVFLEDMEARLRVLLSPEAGDARLWLKQFSAVAVNPEQQLGRSKPDVLNMSAAEIRHEIQWLEQHRASRQQSQAAFNQTRAVQSQLASDAQAARREARQPVNRSNWPANTPPPPRSQYSPRREVLPLPPSPVYMIGPWGAPYFRL